MKAIIYNRYSSPDEMEFKETAQSEPKDNEVLIKVRATSINSWDWDLLRGKPFLVRLAGGGLLKPKKKIIGCDVAGQIESVGKNVKQFQPGDEVFGDLSGCGWGGFAEYVCATEKALTLKPSGLSFEEAAAIPQAGVMALQALKDKKQIHPGQKVLINGAGGGIGSFAIQIAKTLEAEITGVDSEEKLDILKSLGADHVIDYLKEDFSKNGQQYDLIIDIVANRSLSDYIRALKPGGIMVMIGGTTSTILQTAFIGPFVSMTGSRKTGILMHEPNKNVDIILKLIGEGKLKPVIDKCFPLKDAAEAFRYFGSGKFKGKIVITM